MKRYITFTLFLLLIGCRFAFAQSVQVDFDKKIILCDSLKMPANTSAVVLLRLLPEMLQRAGEVNFSTYDIKVEGMSVGDLRDVALTHLMLDDIEKIEVDESPVSSYLNNGVGGSVNIVLRQHGSRTDAVWGSASISGAYPLDISPQVLVGHRSDKFMIRGILMGEVYNNSANSTTQNYMGNLLQGSNTNEADNRFRSQLARAYMYFKPSEKDEIKLNVSQTYQYNKTEDTPDYDTENTSYVKKKIVTIQSLLNWKHSFSPRTFVLVEAQHNYTPSDYDKLYPNYQSYTEKVKSNTAAGKAEFKTSLLPTRNRNTLNISTGCNFNYSYRSGELSNHVYRPEYEISQNPVNSTFFCQPYINVNFNIGRFRAKAVAEFQHYTYDIDRMKETYHAVCNDFTGKFVAEYRFTPHQNLRLILDRKLSRPTADQLFPIMVYDMENTRYVQGDPTLAPAMSHEVSLDYVSDYRWGEHSLMLDVSASYNHVNDIINSVVKGGESFSGGFGLTQEYYTYENNGKNRIVNANIMALYEYKSFTLGLTGNVYHKRQEVGGDNDHYTYFNISIFPQFRMKGGWHGSACLTYNSKVARRNETLSNCAMATVSIGRMLGRFFIYVYDVVKLQKYATDVRFDPQTNVTTYHNYEMMPDVVGAGVRYSF